MTRSCEQPGEKTQTILPFGACGRQAAIYQVRVAPRNPSETLESEKIFEGQGRDPEVPQSWAQLSLFCLQSLGKLGLPRTFSAPVAPQRPAVN